MNTNTEREELAAVIYGTEPWTKGAAYEEDYFEWSELDSDDRANYTPLADAILAAGYRKPRILGYVVVGRDGLMHRVQYETRLAAQEVADEWTRDAKNTGVDWDYRVAEIVEPTR